MPRTTVAAVLVLLCNMTFAAVYHVEPNGSDANAGSMEAPLASIARAAAIARPGDTVILHDGVYPIVKEVRMGCSGEEGNWITFRAADGERPVLDGAHGYADPANPRHGYVGMIELNDVAYLRFIGLELRNAWAFEIRVGGKTTNHLEFLNCRFDRTYASAIWLGASEYCRIIGCEVTNANDMDARTPGTPRPREAPQEAISIARARHFEVAYNRVYRCYKEGIDCKETSAYGRIHHNEVYQCARQGLYVDAWFGVLEDVEFAYNLSHGNEWGFGISCEGRGASMRNVSFHHNLVYNNRASGVFFGRWGTDGPRSQIRINNNTIINNGSVKHWAGSTGGVDIRAQNLDEVVIANNIIHGNAAFEIATFAKPEEAATMLAEKKITIANNLTSAFHDDVTDGGMFPRPYPIAGQDTITGAPKFANVRVNDLRLLPDSPAVGAAKPGLVPAKTGGPDIGALGAMQPMP